VAEYLEGQNVSTISKFLYRSPSFVKAILDKIGVPQRPSSKQDRRYPAFLPESCVSEDFSEGEIVWSAHYHAPAVVEKEYEEKRDFYLQKYDSKCYKIYIFENGSEESLYVPNGVGGFYGASLAYDLGKLSHIADMGIDLRKQVS